ncbi:MAG: enterochelin esterase, partial [Pseudomonadales bacterium]
ASWANPEMKTQNDMNQPAAAAVRQHRHPLVAQLSGRAIDEGDFWKRIEAAGAPLVEREGNDDHSLVTFVWQLSPQAEHAVTLSRLGEIADNVMNQVRGTRVAHLTYRFRNDVRLSYGLVEDVPIVCERDASKEELARFHEVLASTAPSADPFNPDTFAMPGVGSAADRVLSLFALADAPDESLIEKRAGIARGWIETHQFASRVLGNERTVWVQTPAQYNDSDASYGVVLLFDGGGYLSLVPTHRMLDNLSADGLISPVIGVFVDNATPTSRNTELPCNEKFAAFLREELMPWLHESYRVSDDPALSAVAGSSFGGLASMWIGHELPDLFGNVISQAGSFWWGPGFESSLVHDDYQRGWLIDRFRQSPKRDIRIWLEIGLFETFGVPCNREMRDALVDKGYDVSYREFCGGHDYALWRGTLAQALPCLLG